MFKCFPFFQLFTALYCVFFTFMLFSLGHDMKELDHSFMWQHLQIRSAEDPPASTVVWVDHNPRLCQLVQVWHIARAAVFFLYPMSCIGVIHHYHRLQFLWQVPASESSAPTHENRMITQFSYRGNIEQTPQHVLSSLVNIPSCTHSLCQDAFEGHKYEAWWYWEKRDFKTISCNSKEQRWKKGLFKFKLVIVMISEICPVYGWWAINKRCSLVPALTNILSFCQIF